MAIKNIINNDKLKSDIVDFNEFKYNQITKELRNYLIEFAYNQKLQFQIVEAYYIWKSPLFVPYSFSANLSINSESISERNINGRRPRKVSRKGE